MSIRAPCNAATTQTPPSSPLFTYRIEIADGDAGDGGNCSGGGGGIESEVGRRPPCADISPSLSLPPSSVPPEAFESIDHRQRDPLPFAPRTGVQGLLEIAGARVARDMEARKRGFFLFVVKKAISTSQPSINRDSSTATDGQLALGGRFTIEIPSEAAADFATRFTTSPRGTQPLTRSQLHRGLERGNGDWSLLSSSESTAT